MKSIHDRQACEVLCPLVVQGVSLLLVYWEMKLTVDALRLQGAIRKFVVAECIDKKLSESSTRRQW